MDIKVRTITPDLATQWLNDNVNNRSVRTKHVKRIAASIRSGDWKLTGDPIRFSGKRLIDGQHRLLAIVEAGVSVESVVIFGLEDEVFDYIDQGAQRTARDIIGSHSIPYSTVLAPMIRLLAAYDKGQATLHLQGGDTLTSAEIVKAITEEHIASAAFGKKYEICRVIAPSMLAAWHFLTAKLDHSDAEGFWMSVCSADNKLREGAANASLLRDRLLSHASQHKRMTVEHKFTWAVRAWNAERYGVVLQRNGLKFVAGDPIPRFE